ncbi:hypothetical protein [Saccharothrix stipae]
MPEQPRIPDDVRDAVLDDVRTLAGTREGSVRAIARRHGISKSSVGRLADDAGLGDAWAAGSAQTAQATESRLTYVRGQRALLQEDLVDKASDLVDRMDDLVTHLNVVKVGEYQETVEHTVLPPGPGDYRAMAAAITALTRGAVDLAKLDNDTSRTEASVGLIDDFYRALENDPDVTGDEEPPPASEPA